MNQTTSSLRKSEAKNLIPVCRPHDSTHRRTKRLKRLLELKRLLISEFGRAAVYKINKYKFVALVYR